MIASLVTSILSSFERIIANSKANSQQCASAISSHLARFRLWSASSGAHRPAGIAHWSINYAMHPLFAITSFPSLKTSAIFWQKVKSLSLHQSYAARNTLLTLRIKLFLASRVFEDDRLADALSSKELGQNLEDVDDQLANYLSQNNLLGETTVDEHLEDIKHAVDRLLRLAVLIRSPNPHDHFSSRYGTYIVESSKPFDISHVREKFPGLNEELASRLGRSLSIRRQYFLYREEHFNRLADGLITGVEVEAENPNLDEQATTVASPVPRRLEDQNNSASNPQDQHVDFYDDIDSRSEISTTTYAASEANPDQLRVPPIPREYANGPFKCPFCHSIVLVDNRRAWKYDTPYTTPSPFNVRTMEGDC